MLYTLAGFGQAPAAIGKSTGRRFPRWALSSRSAVMLIGVAINYFIPERAFTYITSIATVCGLYVWGMIVFTHLRYRRAGKRRATAREQLPDARHASRELVRHSPSSRWF